MDQDQDVNQSVPLLREQKKGSRGQSAEDQSTQHPCCSPIHTCLTWCCSLCGTQKRDSPELQPVAGLKTFSEEELPLGSGSTSVSEPESVPDAEEPSGFEAKSEPEPPSETLAGSELGSALAPEPDTLLGFQPESEPFPQPQTISEPSEGHEPENHSSTNPNVQIHTTETVTSVDHQQPLYRLGNENAELTYWLLGKLEDLSSQKLKYFHWFLQKADESLDGFKPIKKCRLENADRLDTVDLMVQMYSSNTRDVTEKILIKIDQAGNVESPVFQQEEQTAPVSPEEEKLIKMFNDFVKVSKNNQDNPNQLLEVLVKEKLLNESERTAVLKNHTAVNKASCIVEIIMEKGVVQKETINHLLTIEPTLKPLLSAENGLDIEPPSETLARSELGSSLASEPDTLLGFQPFPHPQTISEPSEGHEPENHSSTNPKRSDISSKSTLIRSGCPSVYKLKPKEETLGSLKKFIVGEKNNNTPNKTILVVGETGTGKSTLINALINHAMGVKFEDQFWFTVIEEEKRSQSESQTSDVMVYQVYKGQTLPFSLTIIDTPGYGDTRGIERDVIVREQLIQLFQLEHGVHEVHAVGLVVKSTENRVSDRLRYIYDSVLSLFGKDLEKNIVVLVTHSDGMYPKNALGALEAVKIKCARDQRNNPVHFLFNNRQSDDRSHPQNMKKLKMMFEDAEEEMDKLVNFMETVEPQILLTVLEVMKSQKHLAACIHNLQEIIKLIDEKQREIRQTEEALKKSKEDLEDDRNYTIVCDEDYKVKEKAGVGMHGAFYDGALCCTVCEETCHFPCTNTWYPSGCSVFSKGKCKVCRNRCPVKDHVKEQWRYVSRTRRVKKTLVHIKKKYEEEKEKIAGNLKALKQDKEKLEKQKNQFLEEAYQHVMKLEEITLNVDSLSTSVNLELMIEKMREKGETAKVEKLVKIMNRQDK